jgi:HlyD family secretion protein
VNRLRALNGRAGLKWQAEKVAERLKQQTGVILSRETRANLVFMIEAKFSPADAAELRPGQPVDVELK